MATYSFLDTHCAVSGPGISAILSSGGGVADEGITIAMAGDKNTMTVGADGGGMHSLHADNSGTVTIRLLRTNPVNHILQQAYNYQRMSAAYWGQNMVAVSNPVLGDLATAWQCAFKRQPDFANAKDGGMVEWVFDAVTINEVRGDGTPNA